MPYYINLVNVGVNFTALLMNINDIITFVLGAKVLLADFG